MINSLCISMSAYILVFLSLLGWGRMATSLLKIEFAPDKHIFAEVWLGFSAILFVVQVLHIGLSLSLSVSLSVLFTGVWFSLTWIIKEKRGFRHILANDWGIYGLYGILVMVCALWIASKAMLLPTNYDSGLYHFNAVRWLNEYPLVFGLGNLHGRLAFNQAFFSFVALLNLFPYGNHGHNIANSFLILLVIIECLHESIFFIPHIFKMRNYRHSTIFSLFILPLLLYYSLKTSISSPSPDILIFLIQIVLLRYFFKFIDYQNERQEWQMATLKFLLIMSTCAVTCKLSIAGYAFTICLVAIVWTLSSKTAFIDFFKKITQTPKYTTKKLLPNRIRVL